MSLSFSQVLSCKIVFFALLGVFILQAGVAAELEDQLNTETGITAARESEQITRNVEKFRRGVTDSLRKTQRRTSMQPKIEVLIPEQTSYSLQQPKVSNLKPQIKHSLQQFKIRGVTDSRARSMAEIKIKGVTDLEARSLAAINSSISW
ncbi:MAG: hypothetical protein HQ595_02255 [Candidatus Omnitrophica bacterium]|nr:hypothetical protein [Candidatus Omnitrophota bacterium]